MPTAMKAMKACPFRNDQPCKGQLCPQLACPHLREQIVELMVRLGQQDREIIRLKARNLAETLDRGVQNGGRRKTHQGTL